MNSSQRITLKAFLIALAQQTSPLPEELQAQLKAISEDISSNLGTLDNLGEAYLGETYLKYADILHTPAAERNKGLPCEIDERAERRNAELSNQVDALDIIDRMDDETLTQTANAILSNPDNQENVVQIIVACGDLVL
ncbi:hypothetical protein [Kamptonema formosum]|uniref:hypothetical protein n=1 Tax=Kamptonema formosum TaxID=331992 RepID=UPI00034D9F0A|nr:hypothetical protein [Oscillatoria sp. PCC 10802]